MLFEEFQKMTSDRATYAQYECINKIYMDTNITKAGAVSIWKKSYGRMARWKPSPTTDKQRIAVAKSLDIGELKRISGAVCESDKDIYYDEETGLHFTLLSDGFVPGSSDCFLGLALHLGLNVKTGVFKVLPLQAYEMGSPDRWRSKYDELITCVV